MWEGVVSEDYLSVALGLFWNRNSTWVDDWCGIDVLSDAGRCYFGSSLLVDVSVVRCVLFRWRFSPTKQLDGGHQDEVSACYLSMGNSIGSAPYRGFSLASVIGTSLGYYVADRIFLVNAACRSAWR